MAKGISVNCDKNFNKPSNIFVIYLLRINFNSSILFVTCGLIDWICNRSKCW